MPTIDGGRVSEWEARAMRKHDQEQARIAHEQVLPVRARIQNESGAARRRRSTEIRQVEQARQWDRQREDIHSTEVTERLADIEAKKLAPPKIRRAVPDADVDRPVCILRPGTLPRHYYLWVSTWRDGAEAKLHGEVFRRFIRGWLQTGVDRRRIKGV